MTDTVRPARTEDLPRLRAIQTIVLAEPWPELLSMAADGPPVCLVYADPDPTGYALAVTGDPGESAYLAELAVAEGNRGEGKGSALLSALIERLRNESVPLLRVTVRAVDERARSFYEDNGFEVAETLSDHYDAGDGLLLTRRID